MEFLLIFLALLLSFIGILGCIVPGLPGPPLNFIAVLLLQWAISPFSGNFLWGWGIATVVVTILDYFLPVWAAQKFGASREGVIGGVIGMFAGLLIPPVGIIFGLIAGAIIGDMIAGKKMSEAIYSGFGTALGTLFSTGFKLLVSALLTFFVAKEIFCHFTGCGNAVTSLL